MYCPYIESEYPRCSDHLNMQNLEEAFEHCSDRYMLCPVYLQLSRTALQPVMAGADGGNNDR